MLWLLVILLIAGLSFVLFHKPNVNAMGAAWTPPEQRVAPALPASSDVEDAVTLRLSRNATGTWSAEDAVTAPVERYPAPAPVDHQPVSQAL